MPDINASTFGIRQTCEGAWLAWIESKVLPGSPLANANFFTGQSNAEIKLPAVVVAVMTATEKIDFSGYYEADVDIMILSSPDEGEDAAQVQAEMVGQLEDMLMGADPGSSASQQAIGREVAAMPGYQYSVYGFWVHDQTGQMLERHWIDQIKLKVHCAASSGLSG